MQLHIYAYIYRTQIYGTHKVAIHHRNKGVRPNLGYLIGAKWKCNVMLGLVLTCGSFVVDGVTRYPWNTCSCVMSFCKLKLHVPYSIILNSLTIGNH